MRLADYIIKKLTDYGIDTCFMVTGGGSLFLNDALFKNKKINNYFCHHEQSCAMAADSYYRTSLKPALVHVTTGPGGINALNGVYGAYVDSIPMFVLSGQVKLENLSSRYDKKLRQFGDQEANIEKISKPITKYSITIKTKKIDLIDKIIEKALKALDTDRKGPVWIDVPIDLQGMRVDKRSIKKKKININKKFIFTKNNKNQVDYLIRKLEVSKRPAIIAGNGVRFSGAYKDFRKLLKIIKIPSLTVWNSHDLIENEHESYTGRPGLDGERAGNFSIQNCDLLIIIGARMHVRQIGFNSKTFARSAFKIMIDIDKSEMNKINLKIDYKINSDLKIFLPNLIHKLKKIKYKQKLSHKKYLLWCKDKLTKFPVFQQKFLKSKKETVNPYNFLNFLFNISKKETIFITGDGTAAVITFKIANIKHGQRLFTNKGCASMGYDLPALFGSIIAQRKIAEKNKFKHICITGDGSIMMNLQELQTLSSIKENFIVFILNNDGYHSIRQTQKNFFNTEVGCGPKSGLTFPNFKKISNAFNLNYFSIKKNQDLFKLNEILSLRKKIICEVFIDKSQFFEPRVVSYKNNSGKLFSPPLEDMTPRLDIKTLKENMLIPLIKD